MSDCATSADPTHRSYGALSELRRVGELVKPMKAVSESPDETDNRFLECAGTGSADDLVTGNTSHFPRTWGKTQVVTIRFAIHRLRSGGHGACGTGSYRVTPHAFDRRGNSRKATGVPDELAVDART